MTLPVVELARLARDIYSDRDCERFGATDLRIVDGDAIGLDGRAVLVWRGTDEVADWIANLSTDLVDAREAARDLGSTFTADLTILGRVHKGFLRAYGNAAPYVVNALRQLGRPVLITGHSLGGALTVLSALDLYARGLEVEGAITFAAPRAGDAAFAEAYGCQGIPTMRVVGIGDPVPLVPFAVRGYRHVPARVLTLENGRARAGDLPLWRYWTDAGRHWWAGREHLVESIKREHWMGRYAAAVGA